MNTGLIKRLAAVAGMTIPLLAMTVAGGAMAAPIHKGASYNPSAAIALPLAGDPNFNLWDPQATSVSSTDIDPIITLGLTTLNLKGAPAPSLATSWTISPNRLTWTFHLRKGVKWSDGQPFSSADVVYTFQDVVFNKTLGAASAQNFNAVKSVTASGPNTVVFHLSQPDSSLPDYLAWFAPILPKHVFQGKNPFKLSSYDEGSPVGTGPYMVQKYTPGSSVVLTRNPHYFGPPAKIKTITFQIIPQPTTVTADLLNGTLNLAELAQPQLLKNFKSNPNFAVHVVQKQVYYFMGVNFKEPQFQNVLVRQALDYAINKPALIKDVLDGYGIVSTGPISPVQKLYYDPKVQTYPYNPAKAQQLLVKAGYKKGAGGLFYKNGKPLTVNIQDGQYQYLVPVAELVQTYWQKIGVKVNLQTSEWNTYIDNVFVKDHFDSTFVWWIAPYTPDVSDFFACNATKTGDNFQNYCSPTLDKLMTQERAASSPAQGRAIAFKEQQYFATQLPYIWLFDPDVILVTTKNLHIPNVTYKLAMFDIQNWYVTP